MPIITAWATLFCGALFLAMTWQVIGARRSQGVSIGDGGDKLVTRRMRGQANAAEQMPMTLLALAAAEMMGGNGWLLAGLAALFCAARLAHGICFCWMTHSFPLRFYGMASSLLATGLILVYLATLLLF